MHQLAVLVFVCKRIDGINSKLVIYGRKPFQHYPKDYLHCDTMSPFRIINKIYNFSTEGEVQFVDLTEKVQEFVSDSGISNGIVHVFAPHATGIIVLTENDSALLEDIRVFLELIASKNKRYHHPSNAHSHLRSVLLPPDRTLPIINGKVELGTWQSLLFIETDVYPRRRSVIVQILGES